MAISLPYKDSVCSGKQVLSESVTYKINIVKTTMLPEKVVQGDKKTNYTYDECGNISTVTLDGTVVTKYTYDKLNRLKREDNQKFGKSYFYSYDNNGNITAKEETNYKTGLHTQGTGTVKSYVYENGRLISFDGEACTYDALGNPTTYRDKELQWSYGRRLMKFDGNTFKYDTHGLRIGKNSITFVYDSQGRLLKQSNGLQFIYDNTGLLGFRRGAATYIYRKDIQGNIIAILDSSGAVVVEYSYDAWGNHKVFDASGNEITSASHIGNINPFRYRGYYYDTETKLYYLQSRYYDPEVGRFLNMDSLAYADPESINGLNLYAYCGNNPVMNVDPTGELFDTIFDIAFIGWDIYELCINNGYKDLDNWSALGLDVIFALVPFASGGGQVVKVGNKIDNAFDTAKIINTLDNFKDLQKVTAIGESMNRIQLTTRYLHTDEFYRGFSAYSKLSGFGKGGKILAEIGGKSSNAMWLYSKLRTGYKVLDMGIDIARSSRSSSYLVEKIICGIWKYRNIWKWIYHMF